MILFRPMAVLLSFAAIGCETTDAPTPALLASADAETMAALKAALAGAVGRASIELGPGDLTASSAIAVLPPPLGVGEDRSPVRPLIFDLVIRDGDCIAVARATGDAVALNGVECRPL